MKKLIKSKKGLFGFGKKEKQQEKDVQNMLKLVNTISIRYDTSGYSSSTETVMNSVNDESTLKKALAFFIEILTKDKEEKLKVEKSKADKIPEYVTNKLLSNKNVEEIKEAGRKCQLILNRQYGFNKGFKWSNYT